MGLTVEEFVTELLIGLEERIESGFTPDAESKFREILEAEVRRAEKEDH